MSLDMTSKFSFSFFVLLFLLPFSFLDTIEQRAMMAQSLGMTPEQMTGFIQMMNSMPPEQLNAMMSQMGQGGGMGGGGGGGGNVIRLTEDEMAAGLYPD